mmetsp:Transcript_11277/g.18246  ORF Transcript_11277/g.18246 Transcript_11277/m.18246 type:complete len:80 (+) Transcript_11277:18-257(+)
MNKFNLIDYIIVLQTVASASGINLPPISCSCLHEALNLLENLWNCIMRQKKICYAISLVYCHLDVRKVFARTVVSLCTP